MASVVCTIASVINQATEFGLKELKTSEPDRQVLPVYCVIHEKSLKNMTHVAMSKLRKFSNSCFNTKTHILNVSVYIKTKSHYPTCHPDLSSPSQVQVWETSRVQRVDLRAMGIGLHPTTLLEVDKRK